MYPEITALLGAIVAMRTLMSRLLTTALEGLVPLQSALPAIPFAAMLTAERIRLGQSYVLRIILPVAQPILVKCERCKKYTKFINANAVATTYRVYNEYGEKTSDFRNTSWSRQF